MNKQKLGEKYECGPSIYFHSLRHGQTIKKILGGEAFLDLIVPNQSSLDASARLSDSLSDVYYLTNAYFEERWRPIKNDPTLKKVLKKCSDKSLIVKMQLSFEECELNSDYDILPIIGLSGL